MQQTGQKRQEQVYMSGKGNSVGIVQVTRIWLHKYAKP